MQNLHFSSKIRSKILMKNSKILKFFQSDTYSGKKSWKNRLETFNLEMKLESIKLENLSRSWKFFSNHATLKFFQPRSVLSNLNGNFFTSDFPSSRFC